MEDLAGREEQISSCLLSRFHKLKLGVIVPVYKGNGRDPHICNNYQGITLTSVLSKCLEVIILLRLESLFTERGFPHLCQTAYQKGLSCIDAILSTQEVTLKHMRDGDSPYLCFFAGKSF